ncbi:MAG: hypothetical protein A3F40_02085 [Chlamydiae bacterium RIFCSPHIGHO2_12_FULL_27_8]|nr:MAG: hypothetical protein A3F40_02085 [Chlamydiae bacterium RIFCSPHIGHO2_12_FULL_27_8]
MHPFLIENGIEAIPFDHSDIEIWRNNKKGIRYLHEATNFEIYGAIDDIWITLTDESILVDYKAKASTDDPSTFLEPKKNKDGEIVKTDKYKISYKKQIELYQWLFRKNGFNISSKAYFIFANAQKDKEAFNDKLDFEKHLLIYEGNDDWVEPTLMNIYDCLSKDEFPEADCNCDYCNYRKKIADKENLL